MESERRALINFHSQPDWRVSIFESNRRRQLDGSSSLNKARSMLSLINFFEAARRPCVRAYDHVNVKLTHMAVCTRRVTSTR